MMVSQSANMAAAAGRVGVRLPSNKWFQAEDDGGDSVVARMAGSREEGRVW